MALSISDIQDSILKNNKKVEINLDQKSRFIQSICKNITSIITEKNQESLSQKPISLDISVPKENDKYYFKTLNGIVSDLPKFLNDLLESNDYYCLGIRNNNQFLESLLFILDKNYKLLSDTDKDIKIQNIFGDLIDNLEDYYKKFNYKSKKINKQELTDSTLSRNYKSDNLRRYILDYLEINCITLNLNDMSYRYLNNVNKLNPLAILISQNKTFLPILNSYGKNLEIDIIEKINKVFVNKTEIDLSNCDSSDKKLLHIRNYKMADLHKLAEEHGIILTTIVNNKSKKKTKQELYDEINLNLQ